MKIMMIGSISTGKTTLIQALRDEEIRYDKTQVVEYQYSRVTSYADMFANIDYIDTPGEYMQHRMFWCSLTTVAHDADLICFLHDSTSDDFWFSPGLTSKFEKPVIGIITKMDRSDRKPEQAERFLRLTGCKDIYPVSALTGAGVEKLKQAFSFHTISYKIDNSYRYARDYFD